jgi:hypothetical protein
VPGDVPSRNDLLARPTRVAVVAGVAVGASGFGALLELSPLIALFLLVAGALLTLVYHRPAVVAYLIIFLTPILAGINRGSVIPFFRPNEAVDLLLGGALALRGLLKLRAGTKLRLRLDNLEWSIVAMAVLSSVVPLLWLYVRQISPTSDDLLYSLVLWKYLGLYAVIRFSIRTAEEVRIALWLSMGACAVVCLVAALQSLNMLGVPHLLSTYYAPFGVDGALTIARGSSLLSLPAAVGDLAILNLAVAVGMLTRRMGNRYVLFGLCGLFMIGVLSSAEFSSVIALVFAGIAIASVVGGRRVLKFGVPGAAVGAFALWPVVEGRLAGFQSATGLPVSWVGRLNNLRTYFWPQLFSNWNWLLGVRPAARVPSTTQAFGYVWIESGYTWLLWGGGVPLLASYFAFVWIAMRRAWSLAHGAGPVGAAALGILAILASQLVSMIFDPHLTYRGSADALIALLAMARPQLAPTPATGQTNGRR